MSPDHRKASDVIVVAAAFAVGCGQGANAGAAAPDAGVDVVQPIALAATMDSPLAMAATGGYVAWTTQGGPEDTLSYVARAGGSVHTVPLDTQLSLSELNAHGLAGAESTVSVALFYRGVIEGLTLPDGSPQVSTMTCLSTLASPCGRAAAVAASASAVYYSIADLGSTSFDHGVWRQSPDGGTPTQLYDHATALLVADSANLYWASRPFSALETTLETGPLDGGAIRALATQACIVDIAVGPPFVYWIGGGIGGGDCPTTLGLWRVPLAGGTPEAVASGAGGETPCSIASDGTSLYWTTSGHGLAMRSAAATASDAPKTLLPSATSMGTCSLIALDERNVYLAVPGNAPVDATSSVSWEIVRIAR